jgi:acetyl-CoA C-acetyltransferase
MRKVAIIGIGQTPVSEHWDKSLRELAGEAVFTALIDSGRNSADGLFVANMLSGSLNHQENLGTLIADWVGLRHTEAVKVEAACGSGGAAVRAAMFAIASGEMDCAIVVGVEKMTDSKPTETTAALATAADADWETVHGLSFVAINALIMRRYMHCYGWQHADFAPFSMIAHANAVNNPFARLPFPITLSEYVRARMIAEPINLLDASPIGDGAAALVMVPAESLGRSSKPNGRPSITLEGSALATDTIAVHDRQDALWLHAAEVSARKVYAQSGYSPEDIHFFELHDAFSIMSALSLEACGFAQPGQAPRLALDGNLDLTGRLPIATLGGLKARGHPVGATGVYQLAETVTQLRGEAGPNQVQGAKVGLAQNIGGSGSTIVTHLLQAN